ncbi:MAG: hypothetical protein ACTSU5_08360 [Promethearchaeota archaeon]
MSSSLSVPVEYAFQVSELLGGLKKETFQLRPGSTLDDLVDAVMEKHPNVKNFDLRSKYYTIFTEDGRVLNIDEAASYVLEDGKKLNVEILNLDGG